MPIDLSHIAGAVDNSLARGRALALSYNDVSGYPTVSFRGSTQVLSATELGVWTRNPNDGLATGVAATPRSRWRCSTPRPARSCSRSVARRALMRARTTASTTA